MMREAACTPTCPHYASWGDVAPGKGKCGKHLKEGVDPEALGAGWVSVVDGQACRFVMPGQGSLFGVES